MNPFTQDEQALIDVWEAHMASEFEKKDADAAIATMTDRPVLIRVPVNTGATGREALRRFYAEIFIPQMPEDAQLELLTRSVGQNRIIDEFILRLTHTVRMDWFAPGIEPTGRRLALPHVAVKQLVVLRQQKNGRWLVQAVMFNSLASSDQTRPAS